MAKRLKYHDQGKVPSTKNRRPFALAYTEEYFSFSDARKREWYLKHPKGYLKKREIVAYLNSHKNEWPLHKQQHAKLAVV